MKPRQLVLPAIVLALVAWSLFGIEESVARLYNAPQALRTLASDAWPADTSPGFLRVIGEALVETFQIAILATAFGGLLSLPLALIAASNLAPPWLVVPARLVAAAIRVLPSLLWAILAVLVFGLGPIAGVIAMTFYTVGYLSKLQYEALEGLPRDALDAVRAMGVGRFRQAWHVALPEASNALRSQLLFMFEYNVRASSIVGIVGAGGIGQALGVALRFSDYNRVLTIVLAMFVTVALIDAASFLVRRRFVEFSESRRPRWRDVLAYPSEQKPKARVFEGSHRSTNVQDEVALLATLSDAVVAVGDDGIITYATPLALETLGWNNELVGKPLTTIIPSRLQPRHEAGFSGYVHSGVSNLQGKTVRVPARRRDGSELEMDLTIRVFRRPDGSKLAAAALSVAALGHPPPDLLVLESGLTKRLYELI